MPTVPTVNGATTNSLNVNLFGSANGNPATTQFAIQESNTTTTATSYVQADGSLAGTAVWQTTNTWGTITVTGLTPGTTYTSQVKARNNDSPQVETAFGPATVKYTVPTAPTLGMVAQQRAHGTATAAACPCQRGAHAPDGCMLQTALCVQRLRVSARRHQNVEHKRLLVDHAVNACDYARLAPQPPTHV